MSNNACRNTSSEAHPQQSKTMIITIHSSSGRRTHTHTGPQRQQGNRSESFCMSKHRVITQHPPEQKPIPAPRPQLPTHAGSMWARPRKCFPSVCVSNDKHVTSNHKSVVFMSEPTQSSAARVPGVPMVVFQRESRSVSHFSVYGRSKLWYHVRPKPDQLPTVMADPPIQATFVSGK